MASNPYVNKVQLADGTTVIDISDSTATASDVAQGKYFYTAAGVKTVGTATGGGGGAIYQDQDGYLVLSPDGDGTTLITKTIAQNGTYDAEDDDADGYSSVTVNVSGGGDTDLIKMIERTTTSLTVPNGTTKIGQYAFYQASSLTSITIPSGVTSIGQRAFQGCSYLATISIPNTVTTIDNYAFYQDTRLVLSSLPTGLTKIGDYAFRQCNALTVSSLPSTLTYIGSYAFYDCTSLAITSLPSTITGNGNLYAQAFANCTNLHSFTLPSTFIYMPDGLFKNCSNLEIASLPTGLEYIGQEAFYECNELALTSLPAALGTGSRAHPRIGSSAFMNCHKLALTSLPDGTQKIASSTFSGCKSLAISTLPNTINQIDSYAFRGCIAMTSVSCTGSLTIASNAFVGLSATAGMMSLTSAMFPNLTGTHSMVFSSGSADTACQQLAVVDIGGASTINANSFAYCYSLQTLILRRSTAICSLSNVSAFTNTPMRGYNSLTGTVYVPSSLISIYQTANNWSTLYNNGTITFVAIEGSQYELS